MYIFILRLSNKCLNLLNRLKTLLKILKFGQLRNLETGYVSVERPFVIMCCSKQLIFISVKTERIYIQHLTSLKFLVAMNISNLFDKCFYDNCRSFDDLVFTKLETLPLNFRALILCKTIDKSLQDEVGRNRLHLKIYYGILGCIAVNYTTCNDLFCIINYCYY